MSVPRYSGAHRSQLAPGSSARLRSMGCTPTSLANALRCATGGAIDLSGDQVLAKVKLSEETNPASPGWSLDDAQLAAKRIPGAPPFAVHQATWGFVEASLRSGYGIVLQGDSDQFIGGCSGAFDGDHCVFVHPDVLVTGQRLGDPICANWRAERLDVLQKYAVKLSGLSVRYGTFTQPIPFADITPPDTGTEDPMIHVNRPAAGHVLGVATVKDAGTQLCDTERPTTRYPQAVGTKFAILAGPLELVDVDVDGNSPPRPGRREVYLLDDERPGSNAAFGLITNFDVVWNAPAPTLTTTTSPDGQSVTVAIKGA